MLRSTLMTVAMAGAAFAVAGTATAAPFTNGSFEVGTDPGLSSELSTGSTAITGWVVSSGSVDYVGGFWFASNGSRSVDLAGSAPGSLSQTFDTIAAQSYVVTFDLSKNPFGGAVPRLLTVTAGAFSQNYSFSAANSSTDMMWAAQTFNFTAASGSTTLRFTALNDGPYGPAIDNVKVTGLVPMGGAVPEPATWALMLVGFGAVGVATRRRQKVATRVSYAG